MRIVLFYDQTRPRPPRLAFREIGLPGKVQQRNKTISRHGDATIGKVVGAACGAQRWPSAQSFLLVRRGSALLLLVELTRLKCDGVVEQAPAIERAWVRRRRPLKKQCRPIHVAMTIGRVVEGSKDWREGGCVVVLALFQDRG